MEEEPDGVATGEESFEGSFEKQGTLTLGKLRRAQVPYKALAASS
jgi:hypothetical protein